MSKTIEQILQGYFQERVRADVASVYLFGSYAEHRTHRESDVDVGVLLDYTAHPDARERFGIRVQLGSDLIHVLRRNEVDVVILNDAPPQFARHIISHGKRIYCADEEADHAFVRDTQLKAADLIPFLRRMRKIKLERLAG